MMTDQHPLTDDIIEEISVSYLKNCEGVKSNMRNAADWQLEQVIEWLRCVSLYDYLYLWNDSAEINKDELIADLKKAMRPQEDTP
jgi:hypothetical protein